MSTDLNSQQDEQNMLPRLVICRPDGQEFVHELPSGNGAIAGSDRTCSLHLDGEGVASLHCMIRIEYGTIYVKDWYSETGTFVNDQKIATETPLPPGGTIRVGPFTITARFDPAPAAEETTEVDAHPTHTNPPVESMPSSEFAEAESFRPEPFAPEGCEVEPSTAGFSGRDSAADDFDSRSDSAIETTNEWGEPTGFVRDDFGSVDDFADDFDSANDFGATDDFGSADDECDPETFALLKAEVEHLQNELAQRDAKLADLEASEEAGHHTSAMPANSEASETAALVDRLEQLLDELNQSDERMTTMEELLRLAEEANVAEREERRQIDGWVGDIECRIGERESEWNAEMDVLRQRIEEITAERDHAERRIGKSGASKEQQAEFQRILTQVRAQADNLRDKLQEVHAEKQDLEARLEELNGEGLERIVEQRINEAMREERLAFAQEQATMARERAELSRVKMELDRAKESRTEEQSEIDGKFRAFRDHLKDLHVQESQEKQERSLSSRLSKLWKRLEGRSS